MKRRGIVRFQLIALVAVVLVLLYRVVSGSGGPDGLLVLSDLDAYGLRHEAFVLDHPARLAIDATGSFEGAPEQGRSPLAAYGWIFRRDDRQVVWQMRPDKAKQGRGSLAHVQDTLLLTPGTYDVYFTSYGNSPGGREHQGFFRRVTESGRPWQNEARKWSLALRSADGRTDHLRRVHGEEHESAVRQTGTFWRSEPVRSGHRAAQLVEVRHPAAVDVYAVGELGETARDYGWIEDAVTGSRVWEMDAQNTVPAGGGPANRLFRDQVRLAPGLYRAVYQADDDHAYEDWEVNPPFDPRGWGLTLAATDTSAVRAFDPWTSRQPIASLLQMQDDRRASVEIKLTQRLPVVVQATGEVNGGNTFDFGWIEDAAGAKLWEMSEEHAEPAGGAEKNKQETAFLTLEPGTYTLHYRTDDSHAFGEWNADEPAHPERWGVAVFPLQANVPQGAVTVGPVNVVEVGERNDWDSGEGAPPPPPPPPALGDVKPGNVMVELVRVGNEAVREASFTLREPTRVRVRAMGEITPENRSDYGWIQSRDSKEIAWEMTWDNTRPAGGEERNRLYDGEVELQPGTYTVHYQTDLWHAFGGFDGHPPQHGESWGIVIWKAE